MRATAYGTLIINSMFTADSATNAGTVRSGRAWDEGGFLRRHMWPATAGATNYPNGPGGDPAVDAGRAHHRRGALGLGRVDHASVQLDAHRGHQQLPANRCSEYMNTGAGAAP
jgi:pectin methylesterase-like acyl-CoA thioesterase